MTLRRSQAYEINLGQEQVLFFSYEPNEGIGIASVIGAREADEARLLRLVKEHQKESGQKNLKWKLLGTVSDWAAIESAARAAGIRWEKLVAREAPCLAMVIPKEGRLQVQAKNTNVQNEKAGAAPMKKRRVLVVDDSKTIRDLLEKILTAPGLEVVGKAASPLEAEPMIRDLKPDVITLDIHMPEMNGVDFLKKFLPIYPVPTVMVTSVSLQEGDLVLRALEIGAVDYIQKPTFEEIQHQAEQIREKVITAASVRVKKAAHGTHRSSPIRRSGGAALGKKIIGIGASTGGTEALKEVLLGLPERIPPILIVQHIPPVFSTAFARRVNELCPFEVKEAEDGDEIRPDRVLIAPGDFQMAVERKGAELKVRIFKGEKVNRHRPSVDVLFSSLASVVGKEALGVILTGMGSDGAKGLLEMRKSGAHTIGQDENTSVVYGMPRAAAQIGAVAQVEPLQQVAEAIVEALTRRKAA